MTVHIGNGKCVPVEEIVGIFDLDTATVSHHTRQTLTAQGQRGRVLYEDEDLPRSFVVCRDGSVRLSRLSSSLLHQRAEETVKTLFSDGIPGGGQYM